MSLAGAPVAVPGTAPDADALHVGVLEELDGSPIRPVGDVAATPLPWSIGLGAAAAITVGRPGLWTYALLAFLARGGVVLIAIPTLVLPTFIGVSNFVGPASVSAAGPGPRLLALVGLGIVVAAAVTIAGTILGAAAETALLRGMAAAPGGGGEGAGVWAAAGRRLFAGVVPATPRAGAARVTAIRLVLVVPVVAAIAAAVTPWVAVAYRELSLPSDVGAPLLLRILGGAPAATWLVVAVWLVGEVVGGFATRRVVLLRAGAPRALAAGLVDPFRSPIATLVDLLLAVIPSLVALAIGAWAVGAAWEAARRALVDEAGALTAVATALLLAAAWVVALVLAAAAAGWRAALATTELLRRRPAGLAPDEDRHATLVRRVG